MIDHRIIRSLDIIHASQAPSGAYLASPNFPTYNYCWFRDGAFIAYAMDLYGEHESAGRFHNWAAAMLNARAAIVRRAVAAGRSGAALEPGDILHTRYAVDGAESVEEWPNHQLDGLGTWLWSLEQHANITRLPLAAENLHAAGLVANYLEVLWTQPCSDCWEEFPDQIHPHTLAAVYSGLRAESQLSGTEHDSTLGEIHSLLSTRAVYQGAFTKFLDSQVIDASLLGLAVPYRVVSPDDERMRRTVNRIESELRVSGGGVHRYREDTYYGGGEWVLLTAWLGWYYTQIGEDERARDLLTWVESCADREGNLPEQIPANLNDPRYYPEWVGHWGEIANPLLWSHAMQLILRKSLSL